MALLLSYLLFAEGILSLTEAWNSMKENVRRYRENRIFAVTAICSAGWSFCFGYLIVQDNEYYAYLCRSIGLFFTFLYLTFGIILVCWWTKVETATQRKICLIVGMGLFIYPAIIGRDDMEFSLTKYGMSYSMTSGIGNTMYILFSVVLALLSFGMIFSYLLRTKRRRDKILTYQLLVSQIVLSIGMIFDTIFPLLGIEAFPGSSIAQGITMIIMYRTLCYSNDLRVSMEKMGGYVHELVDTPILLFDELGILRVWNNATENFFGTEIIVRCGEMGNINKISQLFAVEEPVFYIAEPKIRKEAECLFKKAICRLEFTGIYDKYGDLLGYIAVVTDLTAERKRVKELGEAKREAEEANAAKTRFLANMSHEIRTPMHAIIGFSELILQMSLDKKIKGYVEDIKLASHNLLGIINDILDISKLEAGKMDIVEVEYQLSSLLRDLWVVIFPAAERKGLSFNMETDGDIYENLYGDKVHIREVLLNILNNAIKYTKKGHVIFHISQQVISGDTVQLVFAVEDTGVGIKEEDRKELFQAFSQVDKKVHYGEEGSGLGLAIANDYVKLMKGNLEVESEYGKGSVFRIILPQKYRNTKLLENKDIEERNPEGEKEEKKFSLINRRILVVDDNKVNLRVAKGILGTYTMNIDCVDNGAEAVELCRNTDYHIIFMDQMMPEMDGVETMKEIRLLREFYRKEAKIVVLTANALIQEKERLLAVGFDGYLGKPMEIIRLEKLLLKLIPSEYIRWKLSEEEENNKKNVKKESIEEEELKKALPEVDVQTGIENCGGQTETYLDILHITLRYGWEQLELIKTLWEQKNYEDYTIKVHALKSTAANIGDMKLAEMAKTQEKYGKQKKYDKIDEEAGSLLEHFRGLLEKLERLPGEAGKEQKEKAARITPEEFVYIKEELLRLSYEFDFQEMERVLDKVRQCEMDEQEKSMFSRIQQLLDGLEIEKIREILMGEDTESKNVL